MKIILTIPTLTGGGAERVVAIWAGFLAEEGYNVTVLLSNRENNEYWISSKVSVISIAPTASEYKKMRLLEKIKARRKIITQIDPDIVIPFLQHIQIQNLFACMGKKIAVVETIRNSPWKAEPHNVIERFLWKKCFARSKAVIVQCEAQKAYFSKKVQKKCYTVWNPVDDIFLKLPDKSFDNRQRKLVAVGRITPQKNYLMLLNAMKVVVENNPEVILSIYGAGENGYDSVIQQTIIDLNLSENVFLCGRTTNMAEALTQHDIFVMSSDFEGLPNALIESMAAGLLCISTDCPTGPNELIDDKINGFLIPCGDSEKMAEVINDVINLSTQDAERISLAARQKIETLCGKGKSIALLDSMFKEI